MPTKKPIEYRLVPRSVAEGASWVTVTLHNTGDQTLQDLSIGLHSLDTYAIHVMGTGTYIAELPSGSEEVRYFQGSFQASGELYISADGQFDGDGFHWESPGITVQVGGQPAELVSLLALREPHARLGEPIKIEARVRGLVTSLNLVLEFWAETPSGEMRSLDKLGIGELLAGEDKAFQQEIIPDEQGVYILHGYLYQGPQRIGHRTEYLSISL
jgi:hypothetical protein